MADSSQLAYILFGIYAGLCGVGLVLFGVRSEKEPIRSRNRTLVVLQMLATIGFHASVVFAFSSSSPSSSFSSSISSSASTKNVQDNSTSNETISTDNCAPSFFTLPLMIPVIAMPYIYRSFQLLYNYVVNKRALKVNKPDGDDPVNQNFPAPVILFPKHWAINNRWVSGIRFQISIFFVYTLLYLAILLPIYFTSLYHGDSNNYYFKDPQNYLGCNFIPAILIAVQTALLLALMMLFAHLLRKVEDTYYIKLELRLVTIFGSPFLLLAAILYFIPSYVPGWLTGPNVMIIFNCICLLFSIYMPCLLSFQNLISWVQRDHLQSQSSAMNVTGRGDFFFQCLQDEKMCKSFEKFCVASFAVENLFFYKHALHYRQLEGEFLKTEAYRMRHEYISPESVFEVELNPNTKDRILKRIENGEIDDTLFLEAEQEIYLVMRHAIFPIWKRSDMFKEAIRGGLHRSRSLIKGSSFVTPVDIKVFESEKARRRSMEDRELGSQYANPGGTLPKRVNSNSETLTKVYENLPQPIDNNGNPTELITPSSRPQSMLQPQTQPPPENVKKENEHQAVINHHDSNPQSPEISSPYSPQSPDSSAPYSPQSPSSSSYSQSQTFEMGDLGRGDVALLSNIQED